MWVLCESRIGNNNRGISIVIKVVRLWKIGEKWVNEIEMKKIGIMKERIDIEDG